jgi:uncharacterized protein
MNIPPKEECYSLLEKYKVPKHIRAHIEQVTRVAVFIAKRLNEKGILVNTPLVEAGALLHDLMKPIDFHDFVNDQTGSHFTLEEVYFFSNLQDRYPDMKHEDAAYIFFVEDYPELALLIRKHGYRCITNPSMQPFSWEEKVLTYADKRVAHERIVSLKERFEEGHSRYFTNASGAALTEDDLKRIDSAYFELEKEITEKIGIEPEKIAELA